MITLLIFILSAAIRQQHSNTLIIYDFLLHFNILIAFYSPRYSLIIYFCRRFCPQRFPLQSV